MIIPTHNDLENIKLYNKDFIEMLVDDSLDAHIVLDDKKIIYANKQSLKVIGKPNLSEVIGKYYLKRLDCEKVELDISIRHLNYEDRELMHLIAQVNKCNKKNDEPKTHIKIDDTLSEFSYFKETFLKTFYSDFHHRECFSIILIDVDEFKKVNEIYGYSAADKLIIEVYHSLKKIISINKVQSRVFGSKFIICTKGQNKNNVARFAKHAIQAISQPYIIEGLEIMLNVSVGIYRTRHCVQSFEEMIKNAEIALGCSKNRGGNYYTFYEDCISEVVNRQSLTAFQIKRGMENNEFEIFYQPLIDLSKKTIVGAEALLRWKCDAEQWIQPSKFIPIAEASKLIIPLGNWMFKNVCKQIVAWENKGIQVGKIAVNISAIQLQDKEFISVIEQILKETAVKACHIEFEITESALISDFDATNSILKKLSKMGISISLDDFGVGYSSLCYLKTLCVNGVKLDRLFIKDICKKKSNLELVKSIVVIAHTLKLKVTGEGVENERQLRKLEEANCNLVQGYLFSKALPRDAFEALLKCE